MCGVVFDVDDTLYDMAQPFFGAYQRLYGGMYELPMQLLFLSFRRYSDERFVDAQTGRMTMEDLYIYRLRMTMGEYGIEVTDAEALEFQQIYMSLQYQIKLSPIMKRLLDELQEYADIGIITNGESLHQWKKLYSLDVSTWVPEDRILVSGDHAFRKPDVRIFREMERRLNLSPEQLLYVGDAFGLDVVGAHAAGWKSIWFNHRHRAKPDNVVFSPDDEVSSEDELSAVLMEAVKKGL